MTKNITYQQALKYLVPDRIIKSYGEVVNKQYQLLDTISGSTAWCDFRTGLEWGEFTFTFQADLLAKFYNQKLYKINIAEVEAKCGIKIDPNSIPVVEDYSTAEYPVRSKEKISESLETKLLKSYPFQKNGYTEKGTLLISILDATFGGFVSDQELQAMNVLEEIQQEFKEKFQKSCFKEVVLIDGLVDPKLDPANSIFRLFSAENPL